MPEVLQYPNQEICFGASLFLNKETLEDKVAPVISNIMSILLPLIKLITSISSNLETLINPDCLKEFQDIYNSIKSNA